MAKLTTDQRKALLDRTFGLPRERKYPMPDKTHARNPLARASQQRHADNLTAAQQESIDVKAHRILGHG